MIAGMLVHGATHVWAETTGPRSSRADLRAEGSPDSSLALPCSRPPDVARPGRTLGDAPRDRDFEVRIGAATAGTAARNLSPGSVPRTRSHLVRITRASLASARGDPDDPPH
jgi:hypothetical protein